MQHKLLKSVRELYTYKAVWLSFFQGLRVVTPLLLKRGITEPTEEILLHCTQECLKAAWHWILYLTNQIKLLSDY